MGTLPTAVNVIEGIIEGVGTGKRRLCYTTVLIVILFIIGMMHYLVNAKTGCPYIMDSCRLQSTCAACSCCYHQDVDKKVFCYYKFLGSGSCEAEPLASECNMKGQSCQLATAGGCNPVVGEGGSFHTTPRQPTLQLK